MAWLRRFEVVRDIDVPREIGRAAARPTVILSHAQVGAVAIFHQGEQIESVATGDAHGKVVREAAANLEFAPQ